MKSVLCLPFLASLSTAAQLKGYLEKDSIPSSGKEWVTLDNGVEFQAGSNSDPRVEHVRKLWGASSEDQDSIFVDGTETYYDGHAQAWRLLGFYVDCNSCGDANNEDAAGCLDQEEGATCQRYLLWAAYVDLDYSGNGAGEYKYYDRQNKKWSNAACKESGSERCARMDCHEPSSHFSLLGLFKEPDYGDFLDQLTENQGDCVWTDEEYKLMQYDRENWPQECTLTDSGLYYDVKPGAGGTMGIGLYTDEKCSVEYEGDTTVEQVMASMANDDDAYSGAQDFSADLAAWNDAFDAFKICQPCKTSNILAYISDSEVNADGDRYQNRDDQGDDDVFTCQESGGGLNQCMQFRQNTNMLTASFKDVAMAEEQGTVAAISVGGISFGKSEAEQNSEWQRVLLSALFMLASICLFFCALNRCQASLEDAEDLEEPLVEKNSRRSRSRQQRR